MDNNLTLILKEFNELKGQFIINASHKIVRLVAISEDPHDYYYVTYDGQRLSFQSCVGGIMPLKGYLRDNDYNELVRSAKLNHYDQPTAFNRDKNSVDFTEEYKKTLVKNINFAVDKLLTEVHWDLN